MTEKKIIRKILNGNGNKMKSSCKIQNDECYSIKIVNNAEKVKYAFSFL